MRVLFLSTCRHSYHVSYHTGNRRGHRDCRQKIRGNPPPWQSPATQPTGCAPDRNRQRKKPCPKPAPLRRPALATHRTHRASHPCATSLAMTLPGSFLRLLEKRFDFFAAVQAVGPPELDELSRIARLEQ